ncbi:MAG: VWA domain-containing protein [Gammaproteobacteria bacterium]|nr:VWA domain-containing protein [Gammaproteobacteria bacterium]
MPKLNANTLQTVNIGAGNFRFSAVRPEHLGATEYTLVTIVVDVTASVAAFKKELLEAVKTAVEGCRKSPRADNLLLRLITFNTERQEVHGFKPLNAVDSKAYKPFKPHGMTALFDATYDAVTATLRYAKMLVEQDFDVNAAIYIITDGWDNSSTVGPRHIAEEIRAAYREETVENLITVLIGVNTQDATVQKALQDFKDEAELTQYLAAGAATPQKLAKLADFVSRSISVQSQALGSGQAGQSLTF